MKDYFWFVNTVDDDVVTLGVKALAFVVSITTALWLVTFVLVMIQIIENDTFFPINALLFAPMWCGTIISISASFYISINVCRNAVLVTKERREYMQAYHIDSDLEYIEYDSLPLCRKLFCLSITVGISTSIALISQILFYLWFAGVLEDVWDALSPIITLCILYQIYMYAMKFFSLQSCLLFTLIVVQMVSTLYS